MTSKEIAETTMHNALSKFLDENATVYANDKAFTATVALYKSRLNTESGFGPLLAVDNTTYSIEKSKLKTQMATDAAHLAGFAYVALNLAGNTKEAAQLNIRISDYLHLTDIEAQDLSQTNLNLMQQQVAVISPDYVTAADLTNLGNTITAFANAKGTSESINEGTPAQRAAFKTAIANTNAVIDDMRLLVRKYAVSNKLFHDQLLNQATVINVNIHHTSLSAVITAKVDGSKIANAAGTLSNSKKTGSSDANGNLLLEEIVSGDGIVLTVTASGYKTFTQTLKINRGRDNHVEVAMEKI